MCGSRSRRCRAGGAGLPRLYLSTRNFLGSSRTSTSTRCAFSYLTDPGGGVAYRDAALPFVSYRVRAGGRGTFCCHANATSSRRFARLHAGQRRPVVHWLRSNKWGGPMLDIRDEVFDLKTAAAFACVSSDWLSRSDCPRAHLGRRIVFRRSVLLAFIAARESHQLAGVAA